MRYTLALLFAFLSTDAIASDLRNVVKIDSGFVVGSGTAVRAYKGIPYAAPPVGNLRWQAPQAAKPWKTIRSARTFSLSCAQGGSIPKSQTSEDCLTINVWTPASSVNAKLPVLFSIYGGGFEIGTSSPALMDGERLASQGVVVVTFNYRVGVFGFLAHPELSKESPEGVSGNYALLDMIAALQWTQRNIAAFGGDPSNVTAWGESAGGSAVSLLLVMPQAKGLFHKAIANSPWSMYYPMSRLAESWAGRLAAEEQGARYGSLAALREKSVDELLKLDRELGNVGHDREQRGAVFRPVIDGKLLPDDPAVLFGRGAFHHVPLIAGTNADEGTVPLFAPQVNTVEQANKWVGATFGPEHVAQLATLYGIASDPQARATATKLAGDALFAMGTRSILRAAVKYNPNVYQYEFTRINGVGRRTGFYASHGSDLGYTFGTMPESLLSMMLPAFAAQPDDFDAVDERLSQAMMGAIVQFAKTGNPNGKGLPNWMSFRNGESYLEYGDTIVEKRNLRSQHLDQLDAIFAVKRRQEPVQQ